MKKVYNIYADCGNFDDFMGISFDNEKDAKTFCEIFISSSNLREDRVYTGKLFYKKSNQYDNLVEYLNNNKKSVKFLKDCVKNEYIYYGTTNNKYKKLINLVNQNTKENDDFNMCK